MKYLKHDESICSYHTMMHNNNNNSRVHEPGRLYNSIFKTARAMLFDKCLPLGTEFPAGHVSAHLLAPNGAHYSYSLQVNDWFEWFITLYCKWTSQLDEVIFNCLNKRKSRLI